MATGGALGVSHEGSSWPFAKRAPRLKGEEGAQVLEGLAFLDARLGGDRTWRGRTARVLRSELGPELARQEWLDLVADLLEGADDLFARGLALEALALEGVAGRLLGALLGDTREESAAGPVKAQGAGVSGDSLPGTGARP